MISLIIISIRFIYIAVSAIAPPVDALSAAHGTAPTGPASDPIALPTNEPTVEPKLLLSDAVPLSLDAISVNTQGTQLHVI